MECRKVLLVDEDPWVLDEAARSLRQNSYEVLVAPDSMRAIVLALTGKPDVIVLDPALQFGHGLSLARSLRRQPDTLSIPLLVVTARTSEADYRQAFAAGVAKYLTKPLDPLELVCAIDELVQRCRVEAAR